MRTAEQKLEAGRAATRKYMKKWREQNPDEAKRRHAEWRANNREHVRQYGKLGYYRRKYGLTIDERNAMITEQRGCKICGTDNPGKRGWVVDHCHDSGRVRGILCSDCNLALGHVEDDVEILRKMIAYLESDA